MTREFEKKEAVYEDAMASRYNRDYHEPPIMKWHDDEFTQFVKSKYHPGDRILDLGCGPASLWPFWKKELKNPGAMTGVDLSKNMVEESKKLYPYDDFRVGSVFEIPLESGSVDLVIASSIFHHVPDEKLPEAFKEVYRVLDEHGLLVGREPVSKDRLGDADGWFSGAIMAFRHLIYRLTHTREYPEPENGEHHHAYDPKIFFSVLNGQFSPKAVQFKFPVSPYIARCKNPIVSQVAKWLDKSVEHQCGHEFFYEAAKNFYDAADVAQFIENELRQNAQGLKNKTEFLASLKKAAELLERELKKRSS